MRKRLGLLTFGASWIMICFGIAYQYFPEACKIGDWSKTTTLVIVLAAGSGWFFLFSIKSGHMDFTRRGKVRRVEITSDIVGEKLKSAKTIRIFCSQSGSYRAFIHNRVSSLREGTTIKVMMRADSTNARRDELRNAAEKWRSDIAGRGVTVEISAVDWSPIMFRGWLFENAAVVGWYHRTTNRTLGQEKRPFLIDDQETIQDLTTTFDAIFADGEKL